MTFKKILIICFLLIALPVFAKEEVNRLDYMNLEWWKHYNDEILVNHLRTLYENNYDLKITALKTKQAEENIRLASSNQLPQASFNPELIRTMRGGQTQFGNVIIPTYSQNHIYLPLNASYEIDIWGENYLMRQGAKKQRDIALQNERALYIYITSNFVSAYYNLIKLDELIKNQEAMINLQKEITSMTEKKYNCGLGSVNEILDEKQTLVRFERNLNKLIEDKDVLNNSIAVMLSKQDNNEIEHSLFNSITAPNTPDSLDSTIIQYRPDLINSINYAKKTGYDVRISKREFLPKFTLFGNIGFNAYNWSRVFANETFLSNIGIAPSFDIFSGGRKLAIYRINKYEYKKASEMYEKTVLTSLQEVNDALAETKTTKANLEKSNEDYSIQEKKHKLAQREFNIGQTSKLQEMKSELNLLIQYEQNVSAKIDNVISTISLYNAVGGIDYNNIDNL